VRSKETEVVAVATGADYEGIETRDASFVMEVRSGCDEASKRVDKHVLTGTGRMGNHCRPRGICIEYGRSLAFSCTTYTWQSVNNSSPHFGP
jgi:hypothetical protein